MKDYLTAFGEASALKSAFRIVYGWMAGGLVLSGLTAWQVASTNAWKTVLTPGVFIGCAIAEIALVLSLGLFLEKMPKAVAELMFVVYAILNGLTLSVVFIAYELSSVVSAFFVTAGMFGGLALWGTLTGTDLSKTGSVCGMALWGLILAIVVNLFFGNGMLDLIISAIAVVIFAGLTAYDAQKVKDIAANWGGLDDETAGKLGIIGALALYLDFVNLFLHILRLIGKIKK